MSTQKITSMEVAKLAGVSQSAVSRVFTPGASSSKKTNELVRKAAAELGYRPNVLARSLITGKSRMIGLVVAYLDNYFYPEALELLSSALQKKGYHVLIFMSGNKEGDIADAVDEILDYQVDGIIAASVSMSSDLAKRCTSAGVPVVLFNRTQDDDRLSAVTSDNFQGGQKVARFLLAGGHKRIGYIAGWEGASTQRDREKGFTEELVRNGQELYAREVGNFNSDEARQAARTMFSKQNFPDAVFVANDAMAIAVIDVIRFELGLQVPEQVSVVGYDDVPISSWPAYDLTTVRQPANRMVAETVSILIESIENKTTTARRIEIDGPLMVRGSAKISDK
ncbi:MAG: LacI family DNA-binding transcriptional regulator [SAR86 cluster bacterium]|jgi:DNA-binding LacI/PurR family transcriptional regulator|nr:LacI family DNA-binding transcriptional regulator [Candidatus Pseudothioglobus singularis]MDG1956505.1 LacI family DNA-binding transcriptional regulator [Candidatus Thioglobus sp.]MDO7577493.1 LacI family DNA-binding transcriptional regulator [SAR86 cluster bacterium]MDA7438372.1 LacI family DNA-binding transcriptional regulator [Candidatus Pseudothioglobus singularis]MDB0022044.1 LacI family DNA-binding transcriptional regulator [Candidatus Pseudothioglobus singularis]MDB4822085.1 LacI fam|tara:strand:- start:982 stop:1995 length:1014 start_codon:yes stop_codon:yes gene_type:complete